MYELTKGQTTAVMVLLSQKAQVVASANTAVGELDEALVALAKGFMNGLGIDGDYRFYQEDGVLYLKEAEPEVEGTEPTASGNEPKEGL